jgi:hypothetical protein
MGRPQQFSMSVAIPLNKAAWCGLIAADARYAMLA